MDKEGHIKVIAWIHLVLSGLIVFSAAIVFLCVALGGLFSGDLIAMIASPVVAVIAALAVAIFAIPGYLCGKGMLDGKSWSRVLAMVLGALHFFSFPLGTIFCLYTFWVLWDNEVDSYFEPSYPTYHEYN